MGIGDILKNMINPPRSSGKGQRQSCPNCGESINLSMERCPKCGVRIKSMFRRRCPHCSSLNELDVKKCV